MDNDAYFVKECCYEQDGHKIVFELGGTWETGHNVTITVCNDGNDTIENWSILFDYSEAITDIWNAELVKYENGKYEIKNAGWNKDVLDGSSVTFGFACNEPFQAYPEDCHAISHLFQEENKDNDIEVVINDVWDSGCTGYVTIKNNSDSNMED